MRWSRASRQERATTRILSNYLDPKPPLDSSSQMPAYTSAIWASRRWREPEYPSRPAEQRCTPLSWSSKRPALSSYSTKLWRCQTSRCDVGRELLDICKADEEGLGVDASATDPGTAANDPARRVVVPCVPGEVSTQGLATLDAWAMQEAVAQATVQPKTAWSILLSIIHIVCEKFHHEVHNEAPEPVPQPKNTISLMQLQWHLRRLSVMETLVARLKADRDLMCFLNAQPTDIRKGLYRLGLETALVVRKAREARAMDNSVPYLRLQLAMPDVPGYGATAPHYEVVAVTVSVEAHDQGWSSYPEDFNTYRNSWTWGELVLVGEDGKPVHPDDPDRLYTNLHAISEWQQHTKVLGPDSQLAFCASCGPGGASKAGGDGA
ncbi:hypothetical protein VOLCADRAFT_102740 [Volvox carteri f. nagariensis]|uniref:Uncharacterized protein n=1 Tax=Volvox carteri f. nagariensis TaxID=3068 RepID=D8THR8_VOLCA|nr:uncharacterized protein VOLCADRAFT_102740 [Volvox carteri f. nagariensis]EFJ53115.1 hypothetical protein VOLCADRAFT_102740 [Volvox carteri f. nagariensis]|eukprot:XP_002946120.1 hypothetical protein VOLCADRAFT_102740 [Volvox carteri f. nagariensis]